VRYSIAPSAATVTTESRSDSPVLDWVVEYGQIAKTLHQLAMVDPLTAGQAHEWLQFWGIRWATVQRMDRVIAG
jgi:hypothetical protein